MTIRHPPSFEAASVLSRIGEGQRIERYQSDQTVFVQGEVADAVFHLQSGKVEVSVVSAQGKEAVVAMLGKEEFSEAFIAHLLSRAIRVEADLVDQLFNSSEKRLARTLLLLANFGQEGA